MIDKRANKLKILELFWPSAHPSPWIPFHDLIFVAIGTIIAHVVCLFLLSIGKICMFYKRQTSNEGNLNLSFFTTRRAYNRKINLGLIRDAINELSCTRGHVEINHRDDIILDEKWKISGKAIAPFDKEEFACNFTSRKCCPFTQKRISSSLHSASQCRYWRIEQSFEFGRFANWNCCDAFA